MTEQKIVFKRCGEWIVHLRFIEGKTKTNENRKSLKERSDEEKLHAKYRGNCFDVIKIEHLWKEDEEGNTITFGRIRSSIFMGKSLIYVVGEKIEEKNYDKDIEKVCSEGIHYYLDKTTAEICFESPSLKQKEFNGEYIWYYDNGRIYEKTTYVNGIKHGECIGYHKNGDIWGRSTFVDGKLIK